MGSVFVLTVGQLTGRWRLIIMTVLAVMPLLFTALVVGSPDAPFVSEFEVIVLSTMLAGSIAPFIVVSIASPAFANEIEDQTLANLTLSPLPRWRIVIAKLGAAIVVATPFVVGSAFFTSYVGFNHDMTATFAVTASAFVGVLMYAAIFVWLGLVTRQAIAVGLVFVVLWEGFFSGYVAGIRFLSVRHYATALMHGLDPRRFVEARHVGPGVAIGVAAGVFALFFFLSVRRLRRMDVP